jgi:hypothetical protein
MLQGPLDKETSKISDNALAAMESIRILEQKLVIKSKKKYLKISKREELYRPMFLSLALFIAPFLT